MIVVAMVGLGAVCFIYGFLLGVNEKDTEEGCD
jgi:hypothetical protein